MNIDFIKWMCEKAEGFERYPVYDGDEDYMFSIKSLHFFKIGDLFDHMFSLLLQRAIEGVNKLNCSFSIEQCQKGITVCDDSNIGIMGYIPEDRFFEFGNMPNDKAKESSLFYIYEQEKKS